MIVEIAPSAKFESLCTKLGAQTSSQRLKPCYKGANVLAAALTGLHRGTIEAPIPPKLTSFDYGRFQVHNHGLRPFGN